MAKIYPSDEDFQQSFTTKTFNTKNSKQKKIVRYILTSIENQQYQKNYNTLDVDATIEHILPENCNDEWLKCFDKDNIENLIYRFGNLTLLEEKKNRHEATDKSFREKNFIYQESQYGITSNLSNIEEWNSDEIKSRQKKLAKIATSIWKANY